MALSKLTTLGVWRGAGSVAQLFLHCELFGSIWQHVRSWIDISGADPQNIHDHFIQFTHYTGHSRTCRSFLQLVWLLCIWLVWTERNNMLFKNIQTPILQILEKVKHNSFWWLKAHKTTFVFGSQIWWSDLLLCLGIDWPLLCILLIDSLYHSVVSLVHLVLKMSYYFC